MIVVSMHLVPVIPPITSAQILGWQKKRISTRRLFVGVNFFSSRLAGIILEGYESELSKGFLMNRLLRFPVGSCKLTVELVFLVLFI